MSNIKTITNNNNNKNGGGQSKPDLHVVSFSGGKDSTAMLLGMIERDMPIDYILFCDTGIEFPAMYEHIDRVEKYIDRKITRIKSNKNFEYLLLDYPVKRKEGTTFKGQDLSNITGYGWSSSNMRWCTRTLKHDVIRLWKRQYNSQYNIIEYIGLAADEIDRLKRNNNTKDNHRHPLVDWNMTEVDCLQYCYDHGFDWGGLYEYFNRVSCWCCPLQPLAELRQLYHHFPDLWEQLKEWDDKCWNTFRFDSSIEQLGIRFDLEDEFAIKGLNNSMRNKDFKAEYLRRIKENNNEKSNDITANEE